MPGQSPMKRRITVGSTRALIDWYVRDAQRPGLAGAERRHVGPRRVEPGDDRLGVAEQQLAGLRHRDRPRPARAARQLLADDPLERGDLLADRRLRVAELLGGAPERAGPRHRLERREVPHLDAEPVVEREVRVDQLW